MQSEKVIQNNTSTINAIINLLDSLPCTAQSEVLDFVEFLKIRQKQQEFKRAEDKMWSDLSLLSAMRGMEEEESIYTSADIIEPCND